MKNAINYDVLGLLESKRSKIIIETEKFDISTMSLDELKKLGNDLFKKLGVVYTMIIMRENENLHCLKK